jgi:hypothetical protein
MEDLFKMDEYKDEDYIAGGTTLPDYQNFRNVLFQQWEQLNLAVVEFRVCSPETYRPNQMSVAKRYLSFFSQINDKSKLGHLTKEERIYLIRYYNNPELINIREAKILLDITRKLMSEYGVFDLESNSNDSIW